MVLLVFVNDCQYKNNWANIGHFIFLQGIVSKNYTVAVTSIKKILQGLAKKDLFYLHLPTKKTSIADSSPKKSCYPCIIPFFFSTRLLQNDFRKHYIFPSYAYMASQCISPPPPLKRK